MGPGKQSKLSRVITLAKRHDKPHKAKDVQRKGNESVISDKKGYKIDLVDDDSNVAKCLCTIEKIV